MIYPKQQQQQPQVVPGINLAPDTGRTSSVPNHQGPGCPRGSVNKKCHETMDQDSFDSCSYTRIIPDFFRSQFFCSQFLYGSIAGERRICVRLRWHRAHAQCDRIKFRMGSQFRTLRTCAVRVSLVYGQLQVNG